MIRRLNLHGSIRGDEQRELPPRRIKADRVRRIVRNRAIPGQGDPMSFGLYSAGFAVVIIGLAYAAHLMHVPTQWIMVGAVILIGFGILSAVKATRLKDPD
jgi:tetrahydromethanopterin S-methyltransferase subunit F